MKDIITNYFWILVASGIGVFFALGFGLAEILKLIPTDVF
jgi:hypothetical protein